MKSKIYFYDLALRTSSLLAEFDGLYEAPNWDPHKDELLLNCDGRLYRLPLDTLALHEVDTAFATRLNNDHGYAPDGQTIWISDKVETGKSCIYSVPADGGEPTRLTANVPSYWHGVSPDGSQITYAGFRDDICRTIVSDADGQGERILTHGFDHCDGPDFSADGQWIWFNGEKDGRVDLWRVTPDGAQLERMTDGPTVDWFPHPSPDGKHVLYLAYPPGTQGHPGNLNVSLRLMPATGGPSQELVQLFGGQGTINSPCWAPDSRRFAYVAFDLS